MLVGPQGMAVLEDVALLEYVWPYWRKCSTVEAGFEVSYAQATPSVEHSLLLLLVDQDVDLSDSSPAPCLPSCCHACCQADNGLIL